MTIFLISFTLLVLSVTGMAVGVLMKRGSLKGSCGGLNNFQNGDNSCPICGDTGKCENKEE